jgi:hypothetical protein
LFFLTPWLDSNPDLPVTHATVAEIADSFGWVEASKAVGEHKLSGKASNNKLRHGFYDIYVQYFRPQNVDFES